MGGVLENKPKIMLVDDEDAILSNLSMNLKKDYNIVVANSPDDALEALKKNPDVMVVVSDQKMGNEDDGTRLLKAVSEIYPEIMRIILTGFPEYEVALKGITDGKVFDFVVKKAGFVEDARKSIIKALEMYNTQKEMRRLKAFVRQFEGCEVVELVPNEENNGVCDARVVEYDKSLRGITGQYFKDIDGVFREIFSARKNPPDPRSQKMWYVNTGNGFVFPWDDLSEYLGRFMAIERVESEIYGKSMTERKFRDLLWNEEPKPERINEALHYLMMKMPKENLSQILIYNDKGWCTIQDQLDAIYYKFTERASGEKVIIQKCSVLKDARILKVKQEGDSLVGYDEAGKKVGTAKEFVDYIAKVMCE